MASQTTPGWDSSSRQGLRIFISYRRSDASGWAGRIHDALASQLPDDELFRDIDNIPYGDDFTEVLDHELSGCDALLALIGPGWLSAADADGHRRIDDPTDFLRQELEAAINRDILLMPVLLMGAEIPRVEELPASLHPLRNRQALELSDTHFRTDITRLADRLRVLRTRRSETTRRRGVPVWVVGVAIAVIVIAGVVAFAMSGGDGNDGVDDRSGGTFRTTSSTATSSSSAPTPTTTLGTPPPAAGLATPSTGWITLLASLSQTTTSSALALDDAASRTATHGSQVQVLDSTRYSSINDTYWIVFLGPFASEAEANTACDHLKLRDLSSTCYVKPVVPN